MTETNPDWIARLKQRRGVAVILLGVAVIAGVASLAGNLEKIFSLIRLLRTGPKIVGFKLSSTASEYVETRERLLFSDRTEVYRTFTFEDPNDKIRRPHANLVILFTIINPGSQDLVINRAVYDVSELSGAKSGTSGPALPLHTYRHEIAYETGRQTREMTPPFIISPGATASFDVQITTAARDLHLAWLMHIELETNETTLSTEKFVIWLDGLKDRNETDLVKRLCANSGDPNCLDFYHAGVRTVDDIVREARMNELARRRRR